MNDAYLAPEQVADLKERLQRADSTLRELGRELPHCYSDVFHDPDNPQWSEGLRLVRLRGKAEGIRLALSYLNEYRPVQ